MAPALKKVLQYAFSLGLMFFFLYWAFKDIDADALWQSITHISYFWAAAIVLTTLCTLALRGWRWKLLMRPFAPQVTVWDASLALGICYAANVAIPRSGEALRAVSLKWTRGASISAVLATVVVERILDLFWLILFLGASIFILRERINQAFPWLEPVSLAIFAACIAALVALALISIYRERAIARLRALLGGLSPRLADRICHLLETFLHGLEALHSPAAYLEIVLSSVLLNTGYVLIIYEAFAGFGLDLGLAAALVIMAISSIGVVFPTPGAAGTYHYFFGQSLHLLYDLNLALALACATVVHTLATLTYIAIGLPALLWQRRQRSRFLGAEADS